MAPTLTAARRRAGQQRRGGPVAVTPSPGSDWSCLIETTSSTAFAASLRGETASLPTRFRAGTVAANGGVVTWSPRRWPRQGSVALELARLRLERVRDTVPGELWRLDRSCKVFEFDYQGATVAIAVHPDQLPLMWDLLREA